MPGVNLEGSDMQNVFMDYVVLRVRGEIYFIYLFFL